MYMYVQWDGHFSTLPEGCIQTIGTGFTDGKDVSMTIRTGFTDIFVVSHSTRELTERCIVMDKTLYKGHWT